jgi:hypothetical protein
MHLLQRIKHIIQDFFAQDEAHQLTIPQARYDAKVQECQQLESELASLQNVNSILAVSNQQLRQELERR